MCLVSCATCVVGCGVMQGIASFEKTLRDVIMAGLADSVYAVRTSACEQVRVMIDAFGVEWGVKQLLPYIFEVYDKAVNYLHRMVPVVVIGHVVAVIPVEVTIDSALPILLKACKDPVSNLRLCAARILEKTIPSLDTTLVQTRIKPLLLEMKVSDTIRCCAALVLLNPVCRCCCCCFLFFAGWIIM
jgi:hypothetical protein